MNNITALFLVLFFFTKSSKKDKSTVYKNLVAGALAGVISRTVTAPIDRVKVFRQVTGYKYKSLLSLIQYLHSEGGILSFWRGNLINVFKVAVESGLKFTLYEEIKLIIIGNTTKTLTNPERFLAASATGVLCQTLVYPIDTMKLKMVISKTDEYRSIAHEIKSNFKNGGINVFYRGLMVNLVGVIPFYGIELSFYEVFKVVYKDNVGKETTISRLGCASLSTTIAQLSVYPFTVIRSRRQAVPAVDRLISIKAMVINIYKTSGISTFYCGVVPSLLRGVPAAAINYISYEQIRLAFGVHMS